MYQLILGSFDSDLCPCECESAGGGCVKSV